MVRAIAREGCRQSASAGSAAVPHGRLERRENGGAAVRWAGVVQCPVGVSGGGHPVPGAGTATGAISVAQTHDLVVRFAGEGGQGVVTAADALVRAAGQAGYHVITYSSFPSQIMGGPTFAR